MAKIALVRIADDWKGLYIDGKLVDEDHNFSVQQFCDLVGIPLKTYDMSHKFDCNSGLGAPRTLAEVLEVLK